MLDAILTTIISSATTIITVILPLIVAATGRNALERDMALYHQWSDIIHEEAERSYQNTISQGDDVPQAEKESSTSSGDTGTVPLPVLPISSKAVNPSDSPESDKALSSMDKINRDTVKSLSHFRENINLKLLIRSQNAGRSLFVLGGILIALLVAYIYTQVMMNEEGYVDDLSRSLVYFALVLVILGIFILFLYRKIRKKILQLSDEVD